MADTEGKSESFDSDDQYLGSVYAKALLGAADKAGNTEAVLDEFDSLVGDVLDSLPKLDAVLSSPRVPLPSQIEILDKAFGGKMAKELLNFLKVVAEHGRFECIRAMNRTARRLYNEGRGRVSVEVRTAEALDASTLESIGSKLAERLGREVEVTAVVNPDLIGGMVVRVGDTVFDASLLNQLDRLRQVTLEKTTQQIRDSIERFEIAE